MFRIGIAVTVALLMNALAGVVLVVAETHDEHHETKQIRQVLPAHDLL
jgi:hypothetical protein